LGSNHTMMSRGIFEQEQIKRAVELGLGATSPGEIHVLSANPESEAYRNRVVETLMKG
jgi:hypothetical protein